MISSSSTVVPKLSLMNLGLIGVKVGFKAVVSWSRKRKPGLISSGALSDRSLTMSFSEQLYLQDIGTEIVPNYPIPPR